MKKPLTAALLGLSLGMTYCQPLTAKSNQLLQETDLSAGKSPLFRFATTNEGNRVIWPVNVALPKLWKDDQGEIGRFEELVKKQIEGKKGGKTSLQPKVMSSVVLRASNRVSFDEKRIASIQILRLNGRMNIGEGDIAFREKIYSYSDNPPKRLILNLSNVTFDSSGLGEIISAYTTLKSHYDCKMVLCSVSQQNQKILDITGLANVFDIYESEEKAIAGCKEELK